MGLPDVPLNIHWFMISFPIKTVIHVFVACFSVLTDPHSAEWRRNCWFCGVGAQKYMQRIAVLRGTTWRVMVHDAEIWLGTIAILLVMTRVCLQMREFNPQPFLWELTIGITVGVPYFQTDPSVMNVLFCPLCLASSSNARTYHGLYSTQVLAVFWGFKVFPQETQLLPGASWGDGSSSGVSSAPRGICAVRPPLPIVREEQSPGREWWCNRWSWMMLDVWRNDNSIDVFLQHIPCFALRRFALLLLVLLRTYVEDRKITYAARLCEETRYLWFGGQSLFLAGGFSQCCGPHWVRHPKKNFYNLVHRHLYSLKSESSSHQYWSDIQSHSILQRVCSYRQDSALHSWLLQCVVFPCWTFKLLSHCFPKKGLAHSFYSHNFLDDKSGQDDGLRGRLGCWDSVSYGRVALWTLVEVFVKECCQGFMVFSEMSVGFVTQPGSVRCDRWRARSGRGSGHRERRCLWSGRGSIRMAPAIARSTSAIWPKGSYAWVWACRPAVMLNAVSGSSWVAVGGGQRLGAPQLSLLNQYGELSAVRQLCCFPQQGFGQVPTKTIETEVSTLWLCGQVLYLSKLKSEKGDPRGLNNPHEDPVGTLRSLPQTCHADSSARSCAFPYSPSGLMGEMSEKMKDQLTNKQTSNILWHLLTIVKFGCLWRSSDHIRLSSWKTVLLFFSDLLVPNGSQR